MKELMFNINIELSGGANDVYKKRFFIDPNDNENEIAKEFVKSLEKEKKLEYGKDFLFMRVNSVICITTNIKEIFKDEIPTRLVGKDNVRNEKVQTNLQE